MKAQTIVLERLLNAGIERVWQALTLKEQMAWYCEPDDFKLETGFQFMFYGNPSKQLWPTSCVVMEFVPMQKLVISWSYDDFPGVSIVTWELSPQGDKTLLKLTHSGLENIPAEANIPLDEYRKGWADYIDNKLTNHLKIEL